ncbi:MAG: tRNA dihydrouridine synthase [Thermoguttaceae bacterium]
MRHAEPPANPPLQLRPLWIGGVRVDPPVLQAPMAGFTTYAFRQIVRELGGAGLLCTEMLSARALFHLDARDPRPQDRLWGLHQEPRPLAVQIWDDDPGRLAAAGARLARQLDASVIDINFGCPVPEVSQKARSGSYLLRFPERVGQIVARVVEACRPTPVTAKIRLGWTRDTINAIEVAQAVEAAGGSAVTVHGRTADQMFRGAADWDQIARVKPYLRRIPLIGNGDLRTPESVVEAFCRYGVDGVMIGRAGLARPWLFGQVAAALSGRPVPPEPAPAQQRELLLRHYRLMVERFGPEQGTVLMRRYACRYAWGRRGTRRFRACVSAARTPEEFCRAVEGYFGGGLG